MNNARELMDSYYSAFNSKNVDVMLDLVSDDVIHDISQAHREVGKTFFKIFLENMNFHYDEKLSNIVLMVNESGTNGSAEFTCSGTYLNSANGLPPANNQKYNILVGCFFEFNKGLITRISNHYNLKNWIEQVS